MHEVPGHNKARLTIHGICATNAIEDGIIQLSFVARLSCRSRVCGALGTLIFPESTSTSPSIAASKRLFPVPVLPLTTLSSFSGNETLIFLNTYRRSLSVFSSSEGHAIDALSKEIFGESVVFLVISGALRYLSIRVMEMWASIRSVVSSGMTASVTSRLLNTPMAVKATDGVSSPYR